MNVEWWIFTLNPAHNVMEGMMVLAGPGALLLGSVGQAERNASPLWIPMWSEAVIRLQDAGHCRRFGDGSFDTNTRLFCLNMQLFFV